MIEGSQSEATVPDYWEDVATHVHVCCQQLTVNWVIRSMYTGRNSEDRGSYKSVRLMMPVGSTLHAASQYEGRNCHSNDHCSS